MNITKITLKDGGIKGADVEYLQENARKIMEPHTWDAKNMVPLSIEKLFKELREHALNINGYPLEALAEHVKEMYVNKVTVKSVEFSYDHVAIKATFKATADKEVKLDTYKVQEEDSYEDYEKLREIVDSLKEETIAYLDGSKVVSDQEIIQRFAQIKGKEEEWSMDKLSKCTPEQLKNIATTIVEKGMGGMVIFPEEMEPDADVLSAAVEELKTDFEATDGMVIDITKPKKDKKAKSAPVDENEANSAFGSF